MSEKLLDEWGTLPESAPASIEGPSQLLAGSHVSAGADGVHRGLVRLQVSLERLPRLPELLVRLDREVVLLLLGPVFVLRQFGLIHGGDGIAAGTT